MKTITMMQLRSSPGEYAFRVRADGESFLVTYQGKPCFKMVPVGDSALISAGFTRRYESRRQWPLVFRIMCGHWKKSRN
jgi:antitoxin (DNA-binding transcriptional repressor) of toxin-antitoxin stability system